MGSRPVATLDRGTTYLLAREKLPAPDSLAGRPGILRRLSPAGSFSASRIRREGGCFIPTGLELVAHVFNSGSYDFDVRQTMGA